jgi:hypothetical protein
VIGRSPAAGANMCGDDVMVRSSPNMDDVPRGLRGTVHVNGGAVTADNARDVVVPLGAGSLSGLP